ncbi:FKBP-type peptidyl-prolyl cis-trans isomerase [Dyella nitratireducens]|uniref:Peptidyl-prolyl cis-trans isomerase n=1 Tax=Dyella nitratireducens TaxID=1849580 RepID=A0ABQ1FKZ1_9GAMM|nr:FKBP-type peptidyl-prolyl cis-trans isomerase [Dyella nitratireducens]GGA17487.1 peptidyl-prolyl cis-trans isomerase [Dyella nitratireducens]GLQ44782.1 peptidyl-prolyl cis-trans isomerase [Dyella nitratireducens]
MKHFLRPTLTAAALAVALGMTAAGAQAQTSSTAATGTVDKTKASEIMGYQLAGQIPGPMRELVDPAAVGRAVTAALSGQKPSMSEAEASTVWKGFVAQAEAKGKQEFDTLSAKNKAEGDAFLAKNKSASGVKTTASGLQYQVVTQGTGSRPGPNDTVKVNYKGTFVNGEVFDSSEKNNPPGPTAIPLARVIPGFREGLQLMQVGGHYKFFIPPNLAYGAEPNRPFPPNETLIFDVTLVSTGPTPAGAAPQGGGESGGGQ